MKRLHSTHHRQLLTELEDRFTTALALPKFGMYCHSCVGGNLDDRLAPLDSHFRGNDESYPKICEGQGTTVPVGISANHPLFLWQFFITGSMNIVLLPMFFGVCFFVMLVTARVPVWADDQVARNPSDVYRIEIQGGLLPGDRPIRNRDAVDNSNIFSGIAKLSPKSETIVLSQMTNILGVPSGLSDIAEDSQESTVASLRFHEYQLGVMLGWLYSLDSFNENDWTGILFFETLSVDHETKKVIISCSAINKYLDYGELSRSEIKFMAGFYPRTFFLSRGFIDGRGAFRRYCNDIAIDLINFVDDYVRKNMSKILQDKHLTPHEKEEMVSKMPALESMFFLKTMFVTKSAHNSIIATKLFDDLRSLQVEEASIKTFSEQQFDVGKVEGKKECVLLILKTRFGSVPKEMAYAIHGLTDMETLESLVAIAVSCKSLNEFAESM